MNKNRRNSKYCNFRDLVENQNKSSLRPYDKDSDKQNQARIMLLNMEYDDSMLMREYLLGDCGNNRKNLLDTMKAFQEIQAPKQVRQNKFISDQKILCPIDSNLNFDLNDFLVEKRSKTAKTKQKLPARNVGKTPQIRDNFFHPVSGLGVKNEQKTISNLKKILKKLQSPQKSKNQPQKRQIIITKENISKRKPSGSNRITQYCAQFLFKQFSQNQILQSLQIRVKRPTLNQSYQNIQNNDFRSTSNTSQQKRHPSLGFSSTTPRVNSPLINMIGSSSYKPKCKITKKILLFKNDSVAAGQLLKKNKSPSGFRKSTGRISCQTVSHQKGPTLKNQFKNIVISQERIKEQRKSRNLKNILFD